METLSKKEIWKNGKPCIYCITDVVSNKIYIGSAKGHYRRKGQHYYMLRKGNHFNKHLQNAWSKNGEDNFKFEILEFVPKIIDLEKREEYYILLYDTKNREKGFNFRVYCERNNGIKWSEESKKRFSESKKGIKIPHLNYENLARINCKKITATEITTLKETNFNSIKEAAELLHLDRTTISKILAGINKTTKGYTFKFWVTVEESADENPVNSGENLMENPEPNSLNDIKVNEKGATTNS